MITTFLFVTLLIIVRNLYQSFQSIPYDINDRNCNNIRFSERQFHEEAFNSNEEGSFLHSNFHTFNSSLCENSLLNSTVESEKVNRNALTPDDSSGDIYELNISRKNSESNAQMQAKWMFPRSIDRICRPKYSSL